MRCLIPSLALCLVVPLACSEHTGATGGDGGPGVDGGPASDGGTGVDAGDIDGGLDAGPGVDGGMDGGGLPTCATYGQPCSDTLDAGCCSGTCDSSGTCAANPTVCSPAGFSCRSNTDCCTVACVKGRCSAAQCTADGQPCTADDPCCGGSCSGTCTPLNPTCLTLGNPCGVSNECCSSFCDQGFCASPSFCIQTGDACAHDAECCGGVCDLAGGRVGTCAPPPSGSSNCSGGVDGTVCTDCGSCCSRLCAPYGPTGVNVCQPAGGCRIDGDLCRQDSDCCGAAGTGLPGDGNVTCQKPSPNDPVGICRNPMSCNPEGDVCHYLNYSGCGNSSARNDCCSAPGNSGVCELDPLGVPRCYGLGTSCRNPGETCAFSSDCCGGVPCIPESDGTLHCLTPGGDAGSVCSSFGDPCTATADCCIGLTCTMPVGSVQGTCGPPPGSDAGAAPDGGSSLDGGLSDGGNLVDGGLQSDAGVCSQFGQACSSTQACCYDVPCNETGTNPAVACPPGQATGCSCFINFQ